MRSIRFLYSDHHGRRVYYALDYDVACRFYDQYCDGFENVDPYDPFSYIDCSLNEGYKIVL